MNNTIKKLNFRWNKGYYLREGWLYKGMRCIIKNPRVCFEEDGVDYLGVGSSMQYAIRQYLNATGIAQESRVDNKIGQYLTSDVGEVIYRWDSHIEEIFTIGVLHYNMVKKSEISTIWSLFFNNISAESFTKDYLINRMSYILDDAFGEKGYSKKTMELDIAVLLRSYIKSDRTGCTPEDNRFCPFEELKLMEAVKLPGREIVYKKIKPDFKTVDPMLALYVMIDNALEKGRNYLSFEEILEGENNLGKVFFFDRSILAWYLDNLRYSGYISVSYTAGLNTVYLKNMNKEEVLNRYYESVN